MTDQTMTAIGIEGGKGPAEALRPETAPIPSRGEGDVLIRHAHPKVLCIESHQCGQSSWNGSAAAAPAVAIYILSFSCFDQERDGDQREEGGEMETGK